VTERVLLGLAREVMLRERRRKRRVRKPRSKAQSVPPVVEMFRPRRTLLLLPRA